MDCNHETFTFQVSSFGATSNVDFTGVLNTPIKNIIEASIVTCSIATNTSNVVYIVVDELNSRFTDFVTESAAVSSGGSYNLLSTGSKLRNAMGAIYNEDITSKNRIIFYNRYPIQCAYINPINDLSKLSIRLYDHAGAALTDQGHNFMTFRFKCARKNLC